MNPGRIFPGMNEFSLIIWGILNFPLPENSAIFTSLRSRPMGVDRLLEISSSFLLTSCQAPPHDPNFPFVPQERNS